MAPALTIPLRKRLGIPGHDLQMLGREALDQRQRRLEPVAEDDRAVVAPARAGDLFPRQFGELPLDFGRDRPRQRRNRR